MYADEEDEKEYEEYGEYEEYEDKPSADDEEYKDYEDEFNSEEKEFEDEDSYEERKRSSDDEDDDAFIVPEYEEKAERNVFERVGFDDFMFGVSEQDVKLRDPETMFKIKVNAISLQIMNDTNALNKADIKILLSKISSLQYIQYKNATAYILGYIATDGGKKLTKKNVDNVFSTVLPTVADKSVKEPDIIRYSRLWLSI